MNSFSVFFIFIGVYLEPADQMLIAQFAQSSSNRVMTLIVGDW